MQVVKSDQIYDDHSFDSREADELSRQRYFEMLHQ